jgi:hypothetical protein
MEGRELMSYSVQYSTRHASWYIGTDGERVSDLYDTEHAAREELDRMAVASSGDVVILEGVDW